MVTSINYLVVQTKQLVVVGTLSARSVSHENISLCKMDKMDNTRDEKEWRQCKQCSVTHHMFQSTE